ncbi:MAG: hypothetical protein ABI851_07850 [Saprospiraceae bacterium]
MFIFFYSGSVLAQNYRDGDTMYVVSLNGLNIRESAEENGLKSGKLENGDTIIVIDIKSGLSDSIFGFKGCWINVKAISNNVSGYIFDAFISRYPVLKKLNIIHELEPYKWQTGGLFEFMPQMLEEYALKVFHKSSCEIEYSNGEDRQSGHSMILNKLTSGDYLVKHGYDESYAIELELNNVRLSEIYYLVLNLLHPLPKGMCTINEFALRNPHYGPADFYNTNCVVKCGDYCTAMLVKKDKTKYGIFFYFTY